MESSFDSRRGSGARSPSRSGVDGSVAVDADAADARAGMEAHAGEARPPDSREDFWRAFAEDAGAGGADAVDADAGDADAGGIDARASGANAKTSRLFSPYRFFSAQRWSEFRADTPLTLAEDEVRRLRSLNDPVDLDEVRRIYLSLSRLLSAHVESSQALFRQRSRFLDMEAIKTPFVIGVAGPVAVGKSTTARILKELLLRWPSSPKVSLVTTDGFLLPNAVLSSRGLMERKGFPESYDVGAILRFLSAVKAGSQRVPAPVYSHLSYDVVEGEFLSVDRPDILIFEGVNVLQSRELPSAGIAIPVVSDFFDFSIYIDAEEGLIERWYVERFMRLRETAFRDPQSFFHRYSRLGEAQAISTARGLWERINLRNLRENVLPTRPRADLILRKGADHRVEQVALRKL